MSDDIKVDIVDTTIKDELQHFIQLRKKWRSIGMYMETTSKLMLGTTSILSFCTSVYPCNTYLGVASGTAATFSLVCLQFANYSFRESKISTENVNKLLAAVHQLPIPELNGSVLKQSPTSDSDSQKITDIAQI